MAGLAAPSSTGLRGYSRASQKSGKSGGVNQSREFQRISSHPQTAGSQKRLFPVSSTSVNQNTNNTTGILSSKRSGMNNFNKKEIEYMPMQTTSYQTENNSSGVGALNVLNQGLTSVENQEPVYQNKYSDFMNNKSSKSNLLNDGSEFKIGKVQKYQIKQSSFQQKRLSNGDPSRFQINNNDQTGSTFPQINLQGTQTTVPQSQNRKMSLAAKSGQMQIFNNYNTNQTLNNENAQKVSNMKTSSLPPHPVLKTMGSSSQTSHHLKQNSEQVPLGSRQFESYLGRRNVIEQQREKKQELLKQLDMGAASRNVENVIVKNQENSTEFLNANSNQIADINIQENNYGQMDQNGSSSQIAQNIRRQRSGNVNGIIYHVESQYPNASSISPSRGPVRTRGPNQQKNNNASSSFQVKSKLNPDNLSINLNNNGGEFTQFLQQQISPQSGKIKEGSQSQQINMPSVAGVSLGISHQNSVTQQQTILSSQEKMQLEVQNQDKEATQNMKDLQKIAKEGHNPAENSKPNPINSRITRKLEGGRPHKVYDYMFIQMSLEIFNREFAQSKKIIIQNHEGTYQQASPKPPIPEKNRFLSPSKSPDKFPNKFQGNFQSPKDCNPVNLNGLVQIKSYDNQLTDELPAVQCNLLPTQLDHLKVLLCEQEDKNHPKLTSEATSRFEIEKQNQIKQYMEDIITKLQQKDRRFKVTVKKKFVEDALFNSTSIRVASVYVIVVNREKTYDPLLNQKIFKAKKRNSDNRLGESSSEEEDEKIAKEDYHLKQQEIKNGNLRRSANPNLTNNKKRSLYESDNNGDLSSTSTMSNIPQFKKLIMDKSNMNNDDKPVLKQRRTAGVSLKRNVKKEDEAPYKYIAPVPQYPSKYGKTKIKINQNVKAHDHHLKHPINILMNQQREFIKLVLKSKGAKFNQTYAMGLSKALGLNLKKDAFSEHNMKSRDHIASMKEKLIFSFWKRLAEENRDNTPAITSADNTDIELEGAETVDSSSNCNNTPKSKNLTSLEGGIQFATSAGSALEQKHAFLMPPNNIVYKYFIGKGNNSIMVRSLFKNRFWWVQNDKESMENCNFCWTQIKKVNIMEVLPCKFPQKKSGLKNTLQQTQQQIMATPQQKSSKKKKSMQQNSDKLISSKADKIQSIADTTQQLSKLKLYNKIEDNFHVNNKKALFLNMKNYYDAMNEDVFENLPLTFHVKTGVDDPEFKRFKEKYYWCEEDIRNRKAAKKQRQKEERDRKRELVENDESPDEQSPEKQTDKPLKEEKFYQSQVPAKNIWIIKPGENTNRGQGIQVAKDFAEIQSIIEDSTGSRRRTCIVQKYIHNPLLINRRKFDIRTFVLMTSVNGNTKVYIYDEGYLRTSCREFSINNLSNRLVHLTNDAVQKRAEDYGKFEAGNKLSYNEFQQTIDKAYPDLNICFERDILPQMNKMTTDVFRACHGKLDPKRRLNLMEVFGLDFMIDDEFKVYLIEVNTNPCLELSSPLLARLIPNMLENAFKIGLDPLFPPPESFSTKKAFIGDSCPENRFELCFDSKIDGPVLDKLFQTKNNIIIEMDEDELSEEEEHDDE